MVTSSDHFRRRLLWLIGGRAAAVTVLLGSAILTQIKSPGTLPIDPFFFLIGLIYALTVVYSLLLRYTEQHPWMVDVQLAVDVAIVSALVHLTGGVASLFSTLYMLPIIAGSTVRSLRGGLTVGVFGGVLYAGLVSAQYLGTPALPVIEGTEMIPSPRVALYTVGLNIFGFIAVGALSGYLSEGLRRAGQQLEQASNRIAGLQAFSDYAINSLASGLTTTDLAGTVLTMNRAGEAIIGVPAGAVIGQPARRVLQLPAQFEAVFGPPDGRPPLPRVEYQLTRGDGRRIDVGVSTAVLMTPGGESGFVITFQDVTEARRQEREARVQQRLAAVGEMAAGIAHEIRNPLASMSGSIQILRQELPLTEEQAQLMDIVIRESERLNETIGSFLAYARPQRNAAARLDVRHVVTETATLLQNSPDCQASHTVRVEVPDHPVWCLADQSQLRQVVWNLATNGLRAMPSGGELTLSVAASETPDGMGGQVTLAVVDEGVGIAPDELETILQPFRGGFSRGTGLGLSIVHRIVSDYGGELQVTSEQGEGTVVRVKLPMVAELATATVS